jgi:hypothetical protein
MSSRGNSDFVVDLAKHLESLAIAISPSASFAAARLQLRRFEEYRYRSKSYIEAQVSFDKGSLI